MKVRKIISIFLSILTLIACLTACSTGEESDKAIFMLKELPDIGTYDSGEVKSYYNKGPVSEIISSEKYGEIVPFIMRTKVFTSAEKDTDTSPVTVPCYAFATSDGKIISGGIYKAVRTLSSKSGDSVYVAELFNRTAEDTDKIDTNEITNQTDIIAVDGSWKVRVGTLASFYGEDRDFIETYDDKGNTFIYDFSGNELFNSAEAMPNVRIENVYYAKGGKFILEVAQSDSRSKIICVNSKGELLTDINIRGYSVSEMISGVFVIYNNEEVNKFNLSDLNGNILLEHNFDIINYDEVNKCFVCIKNDTRKILRYDLNGNLLNEIKTKYKGSKIKHLLYGKDGMSVVFQDDSEKYTLYSTVTGEKIDLDLENLKKGDDAFQILYTESDSVDESFILITRKDGTQELYDSMGTYITTMTDFKSSLGRTADGGYSYTNTDNKFVVKSHNPMNDFEINLKSDEAAEFMLDIFDSTYISFVCTDSENKNRFIRVYDATTKEIVFDKLSEFEKITIDESSYYILVQDGSSKLISSDGKEIIVFRNDSVF